MPRADLGESMRSETEAAFDQTRPIVDAHLHLLPSEGPGRYLVEELVADIGHGHNIAHAVIVEAGSGYDIQAAPHLAPVGETRFVVEQAKALALLSRSHPRVDTTISAIVGHADLCLGAAVEEVLHAHIQAGEGLFRGVRHGTNWSASPRVKNGHHQPRQYQLLDAEFGRGVQALGQLGLSFDAWLYFDQLSELADLARRVPETAIVLNHLGGPLGIGPYVGAGRLGMLETWQSGMVEVAACENVTLKVGGIGMEHYFGMGWSDLQRRPSHRIVAAWWEEMVRFAIDTFGPRRSMFESNFPVDSQTLSYPVLWDALAGLASFYSPAEQHCLFFDTAARIYGIDTPGLAG